MRVVETPEQLRIAHERLADQRVEASAQEYLDGGNSSVRKVLTKVTNPGMVSFGGSVCEATTPAAYGRTSLRRSNKCFAPTCAIPRLFPHRSVRQHRVKPAFIAERPRLFGI
jgi:hypothetical protein